MPFVIIPLPTFRKELIFIACFYPLTAIVSKNQKSINGKRVLKVVSRSFLTEYKAKYGRDFPEEGLMKLPCGQCIGCRLQRSREWANRCMMELQDHDSAYFVTLTYDNAHVPRSYYPDPDTGEACENLTLRPDDFTKFMKRLRKAFPDDHIRYFMAGEYGSKTWRPHYHAIIYGLHLDDLKPYGFNELHQAYYTSEKLSNVWGLYNRKTKTYDRFGMVIVADVTWETCAYTARYIMKKLNGPAAEFYDKFALVPQFNRMSRDPGLAENYYETHPDLYEYDFINLSTEKGGIKFRPPRYFDKLYDVGHHEELEELKATRQKMAVEAQKIKLSKTTLSPDEILFVEERSLENKMKSLRRCLE